MATYYWVGGSGNWNATSTTNWATSSGGTGGAGVPTSADDVIFDANSNVGTDAFTVTVTGTSAAPAVCNDFTTGGAGGALDGAMTLTMGATAQLNCHGSMTFPASNFITSGTSGAFIKFRATSTGKTVTTNGITINSISLDFDGVGGEWSLGSAVTFAGSGIAIYVTNGTFISSNFNITTGAFFSNSSNVRTITLGSSTITLSGTSPITFVATNLTLNAGTSTIQCSNASTTFAGGGLTFYNVSFTSTSGGVATITGANTFNNLTFTTTSATGIRRASIGANQTINGTLTLGAANTAIRRVQLFSDVVGTSRTITLNGTLATLADVDFRDITAAGTVATPWTGTRLGNGGNVTNITTATPKTVYRVGTGNWSATQWSTSSGGAVDVNNFPLAQDTAIFDTGTTTGTHTIDLNWWIGNFDCSALNVAVTLSTGQTPQVHGNFTLDADITLSGAGIFQFSGASNQTIISAGRTITQQPIVNKPTTTSLLLGDAVTTSATFTLTQGTLNLNGFDLSCGAFASGNSNVRSIAFGTNKVIITGNNTTVVGFSPSTNFTYTGSGQFECTYSGSTGTRQFAAATGVTESNAVNIKITAGTDSVQTFSAHSFNNLDFTGFSGTLVNNARNIYGNLTLSSGMTLSAGTNATTFLKSSGTQTLTSAGKTIDFPITKEAAGTLTLGDNTTVDSTRTFTLTQGTLNLDGKTLSTGLFSSSNSNVRTLNLGANGKITVTGSGTTAWNAGTSTNLTLSGTGTVELTSASAKTFAGGSKVYPYTLNQGGTGTLTITGSNTFEDMTNTVQPTTITFTAGTTTSVKDFSVSGIPGSLVTLNSSSPGTQWNLAKV